MNAPNYQADVEAISECMRDMPVTWDGKKSVLELKDANFQWRQMEWMGFYFEFLCKSRLESAGFSIPSKRYGNVEFDSSNNINWDIKSSAIKSHGHNVILNDTEAVNQSIDEYGEHGIILALLDVEYNDEDRAFQKWHSELKGGPSKYEKDRIARNATSRYRKTKADLMQILLLIINTSNRDVLGTYQQGRNSDGNPRNPKYILDIEHAAEFEVEQINFRERT